MRAADLEFIGTIVGMLVLTVLTVFLFFRFNDESVLLISAGVFTAAALVICLR